MEITTSGTRAVFKDDLGQLLIGGKVYTYVAGTSTPKDAYRTAKLAAPHTNPVILDDAGSSELYLDGGYRLRVYDLNDVFVDEVDNLFQGDAGFHIKPDGTQYENFYASTTTEPPNTTIDVNGVLKRSDDTANAASRKVGVVVGDVVEVGAFGVGSYRNANSSPDNFKRSTFEHYYSPIDELHSDIRAYITSAYSQDWVWQQRCAISSSGVGAPEFRLFYNGTTWSPWHQYLTTANTVRDASGLIKSSSGNIGSLSVSGIKSGVDAPAIAYKKITTSTLASFATKSVPHGLDASKILSVSVCILTASGLYVPPSGSGASLSYEYRFDATNINIMPNLNATNLFSRPATILITYEV